MRKNLFLPLIPFLILCVILLLFFIKTPETPLAPPIATHQPSPTTESKTISVGNNKLNVVLASSSPMWEKGLSGRPSLDENSGMLFIFPTSERRVFWMKETLIPLDIIWVNNYTVVGINHMFPELSVPESSLKQYISPSPANAVIETNLNWAIKNNIKIGDTVNY